MDQIVLRVKDVDVSLQFYTETLGLKTERASVGALMAAVFDSTSTIRMTAWLSRATTRPVTGVRYQGRE